VKLKTLDQLHPDLAGDGLEILADYDALYRGGDAFKKRKKRFLPQRPNEENEVYDFRLKSAHYLNYAGPLVDQLVAWLFTGRMEIRTRDKAASPDAFYATFKEDCDTNGTDLVAFVRDRLRSALVRRRAWVLVDFPAAPTDPASLADWKAQGLGRGYLCPLDAESVFDWERDEDGELVWAITHSQEKKRTSPDDSRDMITRRWTVWERDGWRRFAITYKQDEAPKADDAIPQVGQGPSPTPGLVPLVELQLPDGLWLMDRMESPCSEQMRARNALSWSLARTCYAMRIFHLERERDKDENVHGPAYGIVIGTDEKVTWDAPPADAFKPVADYGQSLKDEIYRVTSQMAAGVDNNAASIGRSGESKSADASLTEIVLRSYGMIACDFTERVLERVSAGRGEKPKAESAGIWHVTGLDKFSHGDAGAFVDVLTKLEPLAIPSRTLHVQAYEQVARMMLPGASQEVLDAICDEIDKGVTAEGLAERARMLLAGATGAPHEGENEDETDTDDEDL
jgi:hypothetical protein